MWSKTLLALYACLSVHALVVNAQNCQVTNPEQNAIQCTARCLGQLFAEGASWNLADYENVQINLTSPSECPYEMGNFETQLRSARKLEIYSKTCPLSTLEFSMMPKDLVEFRIVKPDFESVSDRPARTIINHQHYQSAGQFLTDFTLKKICCHTLAKLIDFPALERLKVDCDEMAISVSSAKRDDGKSDPSLHHFIAPKLREYRVSAVSVNKFNHDLEHELLSDLPNLFQINIYHHEWEMLNYPRAFFSRLPSLEHVELGGLKMPGRWDGQDRCSDLGVSKVKFAHFHNVDTAFVLSCKALLQCDACGLDQENQDVSLGFSSFGPRNSYRFDSLGSLNSSDIELMQIPIKQYDLTSFLKGKTLTVIRDDLDPLSLVDANTKQIMPDLTRLRMEISSCDETMLESLLGRMDQMPGVSVELRCKMVRCKPQEDHNCEKTYTSRDWQQPEKVLRDSKDICKSGCFNYEAPVPAGANEDPKDHAQNLTASSLVLGALLAIHLIFSHFVMKL